MKDFLFEVFMWIILIVYGTVLVCDSLNHLSNKEQQEIEDVRYNEFQN